MQNNKYVNFSLFSLGWSEVWSAACSDGLEDGQEDPVDERDRERDEGHQDVQLGELIHRDGQKRKEVS